MDTQPIAYKTKHNNCSFIDLNFTATPYSTRTLLYAKNSLLFNFLLVKLSSDSNLQ